jgi:excisionase family DNA binding protein
MSDPLLLTPTEAARALGIGRSKLYELLQTGVLESVHIGTCRRIPTDALSDLVARLRTDPVGEVGQGIVALHRICRP